MRRFIYWLAFIACRRRYYTSLQNYGECVTTRWFRRRMNYWKQALKNLKWNGNLSLLGMIFG